MAESERNDMRKSSEMYNPPLRRQNTYPSQPSSPSAERRDSQARHFTSIAPSGPITGVLQAKQERRGSVTEGTSYGHYTQPNAPSYGYNQAQPQSLPGSYPKSSKSSRGYDNLANSDDSSKKYAKEDRVGSGFDLNKEISSGKKKASKLVKSMGFSTSSSDAHWSAHPKPGYYHSDEDRFRNERSRNKQEIDGLNAQLQRLQQNHQSQISQIQGLLHELEEERILSAKAISSQNYLQSTLDHREYFLDEQASDKEICDEFKILMDSIKHWSFNFPHKTDVKPLKEQRLGEYLKLTPAYTSLEALEEATTRSKQRRFFVRGWISYIMVMRLFRGLDVGSPGGTGEDAWLDSNLARNFQALEDELWLSDRSVVSFRSFNDWRAFTAELLGKCSAVTQSTKVSKTTLPDSVHAAINDVMDIVYPWHKTGLPEDIQKDEAKLHSIFMEGVRLSKLLRRQRALWTIRFPLSSSASANVTMFDPACMEDERNNEETVEELMKRPVEFVVTPALYKRGNSNGERYEKEDARCRAKVVLQGLN